MCAEGEDLTNPFIDCSRRLAGIAPEGHDRSMDRSAQRIRLFLTGFEPFGGSLINPSNEAIQALLADPPREVVDGRVTISTCILPVVGGTASGSAAAMLASAIDREDPDLVLCLGETGSRDAICVERVAVNAREYRIADNAGAMIRGERVIEGAPNEHASTLPVEALVAALHGAGVRAEVSSNAGRFLCNEIMFHAIALTNMRGRSDQDPGASREAIDTARRRPLTGAGFVHLPQLPQQLDDRPGRTGMPLEQIVRGVRAIIAELARSGGSRC